MIVLGFNSSSNRKKYDKRLMGLVLLCVIVINFLSGCFESNNMAEKNDCGNFEREAAAEINRPDFEVTENRENELVFDVSLEEFISCYNAFYQKDKHSDYLLPVSRWSRETYDHAIHSSHPTIYYEFSENPQKWLLPTITVYVPTDSDVIQEITLNFDDHGYTSEMMQLFQEICFYTFKVMFADITDEKINDLIQTLIDEAYEREIIEWYSFGTIPEVLYFKDGIGVYPYFGNGQMLRLCIVPVTEKLLDVWRVSRTKIYEIEKVSR